MLCGPHLDAATIVAALPIDAVTWAATNPKLHASRRPSAGWLGEWDLHSNPLTSRLPDTRLALPVSGVEGAFLVPNLLTIAECTEMCALIDTLGFDAGVEKVGTRPALRDNDACVIILPGTTCRELSRRLAATIPMVGCAGAKRVEPCFVNRRTRCYRYSADTSPPQSFRPHYDGSQHASAVIEGNAPRQQACRTMMSVLVYLSGDAREPAGGETLFYPQGAAGEAVVGVTPVAGSALCFWHGEHPDSPLHEGAPLLSGAARKYVLRTDILYAC